MTDRPEPRVTRDMSVVEAWRLLARPAPSRKATSYVGLLAVIGLLNASAIAAIVASTVTVPGLALVAALLHVAVIPGLLMGLAVLPTREVDAAEWLALATGFGLLLLIVGGLVLALLPVRLTPLTVVGWSATVSLVLSAVAFSRGINWQAPAPGTRSDILNAALVTIVATGLRLPGLGYAELQGDETEVVLRAAGVVQNLPDAIFYHGKGPGEVVAVAATYGLLGKLSESAARLPFALAGIGGVVAFSLLARRLVGSAGGLAAGLLLAMDGYFVAFSRISQYQSAVLLLGVLGLWCAVRWSQGGSGIWPTLAGALVAGAALAHYDALWFLPPIALVAFWRSGWRGLLDRAVLAPWRRGTIVGTAILALFFVPYLDSPLFSLVTDRITDRVGTGFPRNNLPGIVSSATLYLGTAFPVLVALTIGLGAALLPMMRSERRQFRTWLLGLVWAAAPFLFYAFVARKPGTHVHVATSGLALLAGAGFAAIWATLTRAPLSSAPTGTGTAPTGTGTAPTGTGTAPTGTGTAPTGTGTAPTGTGTAPTGTGTAPTGTGTAPTGIAPSPPERRLAATRAGQALLATLFAGGLALVGSYLVPVYLQSTAEVVRENRVGSLPLAWKPPGGLPTKERFGFPYQAGWKAIGALYADGTLSGSYDSNEQPQVTYWYTRGAWRCSASPRYYVLAENVQDVIETPGRTINAEYHQIGTVTVAGEAKLRVYERGPPSGQRAATWQVEQLADTFNRRVSAATFDPGPWARGVVARDSIPLAVQFGDDVNLFGYQVFAEDPRPGGVVRVDLYWLPRVSSDQQHRIDLQLGREPRIGDGSGPACDKTGDDRAWQAGRPFVQRVSVPIAAGATPGVYPLLVSVSRVGPGGGVLTPASGTTSHDALVEIGRIEVRDGGPTR